MKSTLTALSALCLAAVAIVTPAHAKSLTGKASFYRSKGETADGGRVSAFTAANRSLPLGSKARVTDLQNHRSVVVTINDRGPFAKGRVIDVSPKAAKTLGFRSAGVAPVKVQPVR